MPLNVFGKKGELILDDEHVWEDANADHGAATNKEDPPAVNKRFGGAPAGRDNKQDQPDAKNAGQSGTAVAAAPAASAPLAYVN